MLKGVGPQAVDLGWIVGDLFGVRPNRGTAGVDHAGAPMFTSGGVAHEVTDYAIRFSKTTYHQNIAGRPVGIPVWEFKE